MDEEYKLSGAADVSTATNIETTLSTEATATSHQRVIAQITSGKVSGVAEQLPNGNKYFVYKGIPYAKPPVGELRFKPPQLLDKLPVEILDCSNDGPGCFTVDNYLPNDRMSEDCLYLNVYTPVNRVDDSTDHQLPVMIWIHGGGFVGGSAQSSMYCPNYLVQEGVVVVTVNYRLGPLGFLCLPSVGIEGNMGLKDQRMSFRWVKENIRAFGGNPDNVTIFGQSAGGASVHCHYLSKSSREFFQKVIAQSGTVFNQWVWQKDPELRARKLAKLMGCEFDTNDELVYETLMRSSPKELTEIQYEVMHVHERSVLVNFPFTPVVERFESQDPIVAGNPLDLIKQRFPTEIPIVMGITSEEGAGLAGHVMSALDTYNKSLPMQMIPFTLKIKNEQDKSKVLQEIKHFFFKDNVLSAETVPIMVQILGDNANKFAGYLTAQLHSLYQISRTYFYVFSYMSELNKLRELAQTPDNCPGAVHGDDLCYLFSSLFFNTESIDLAGTAAKHRETMCKLWSNFAKSGTPTPDDSLGFYWSTCGGSDAESNKFELNTIELNGQAKMIKDPFIERFNFWKSLFAKNNGSHLKPVFWNY